ncbi:hypothetical protein DFH09DRAFT_1074800 [Mycena vulgaris]|nr:hypothetical protein DFH09DRAFT_1074800 [Mycena vulgaris]
MTCHSLQGAAVQRFSGWKRDAGGQHKVALMGVIVKERRVTSVVTYKCDRTCCANITYSDWRLLRKAGYMEDPFAKQKANFSFTSSGNSPASLGNNWNVLVLVAEDLRVEEEKQRLPAKAAAEKGEESDDYAEYY